VTTNMAGKTRCEETLYPREIQDGCADDVFHQHRKRCGTIEAVKQRRYRSFPMNREPMEGENASPQISNLASEASML